MSDPNREAYDPNAFFSAHSSPALEGEATEESALTDHIQQLDADVELEENPDDSPELILVRRLGASLSKAVKAVQIYPLTNPMCRRFAEELVTGMNAAFQAMDVLRLSVGKNKLFFGGQTVLEQAGREESVPGRLFWSGIREISFHVGITPAEVLEFLSLYRTTAGPSGEAKEDDFVTLLWESQLEHITYIAIDDLLDMENEDDPIPEEFGSDFMNFVDVEMHDLEDEDEVQRQANEMAKEIQDKLNQDDLNLFGISNDERDALLVEIQREESPAMLTDIISIIGETLFAETHPDDFVSLVQVLSGALLGLMSEGRLHEAAEVLGMLRELREQREDLSPPMIHALEEGIISTWDPTRREILCRHLNEARGMVLDTLERFVDALPPAALEPLVDVLGNVENPQARRRLTHALSVRAAENVDPLLGFLRDPRQELVCTVATILGASKSPKAVIPLKELLKHREFRVRRAALAGLCLIGKGHAMDVAKSALFDRDPRIRMAAARHLGLAGRNAIAPLLMVIEEADFDERPLTEKRAFYEALGYAGGQEVLPLMKDVLKRRILFRRGSSDELRACACEALGWIGGTEARQLLSAHLNDKAVLVRTAAQSGLRRISEGASPEALVKEAA